VQVIEPGEHLASCHDRAESSIPTTIDLPRARPTGDEQKLRMGGWRSSIVKLRGPHHSGPLGFFFLGNLVGVEGLQVVLGEEAIEKQPDGNQQRDEQWKKNPDGADFDNQKDGQTAELDEREEVHRPARNSLGVMISWVQRRIHDPQAEAFEELIALHRDNAHE
jgi:hypothetical protein